MMRCYEDGAESPREGCSCRSCFYAREQLIPKPIRQFLIEQLHRPQTPWKLPGPGLDIIRRCFNHYAAGRASLDDAYLEIIKTMVTQNDDFFRRLCEIEMLKPVIPHLFAPPSVNT